MKYRDINQAKFEDLLYQALETEQSGVELYKAALRCAVDSGLREEWEKYKRQTEHHVEVLEGLFDAAGLDPTAMTPSREIIRQHGEFMVKLMEQARSGDPEDAQVFACECIVNGEFKDHSNWSLLAICSNNLSDDLRSVVRSAVEEVEDEEDEHLYHTQGWCRELALKGLGVKAVVPPPEERRNVKSAGAAAKAKASRGEASK